MATDAVLSDTVAKPDHIPESLVFDFDMYRDPALVANPHERIMDIHRNAPPIFWTPRNNGHWVLFGHQANFEAARDVETFSNEIYPREQMDAIFGELEKELGRIPMAVPINLDPPDHTKYRQPLQRVFSPKVIEGLRESIRELARKLISQFVDKGECELMNALSEPLPVQVFLKMLGLPLERLAEYRKLTREHLDAIGSSNPMDSLTSMQDVAAAMRPTILARKDNPQDDIISMLWEVEIDGQPITLEDQENYGVLLFIAGLDTVMQGIGHGVRHLAMDQALQAKLRVAPELIKDATEELLRRYTFTIPPRRVDRDIVFQGVEMKKDERAVMFLPGADLDGAEYEHPEQYKLDRSKPHIAFNAGPHRCLGSHLARVELQVVYEELLAAIPQFKLDATKPPTFHCGNVIGVETLNLVWEV
ncbi:cytochrome P450 [Litorivivens sp.]|uniref:cytochrome P450 n=4 Tax=Litorivivens sp. TaxID=2020868 RepID=UPI00356423B9